MMPGGHRPAMMTGAVGRGPAPWAEEFAAAQQQQPAQVAAAAAPSPWAEEYAEAHPAESWASEYTTATAEAEQQSARQRR